MASKAKTAALLAEYNTVRNERLALDQRSKKLAVKEAEILDKLEGSKSGTYGDFELEVSNKKVPRCTDWSGFHAYILQTGNLDMLHKRLTESAIMARIGDGEYVPGIVTDDKVSYKVTAVVAV